MTTETEKSPRQIAESIARRGLPFSAFRNEEEWKQALVWLGTEFEKALRDRDERAATIATKKAETLRRAAHVVQQPTEEALRMAELAILTADDIASAIRGIEG